MELRTSCRRSELASYAVGLLLIAASARADVTVPGLAGEHALSQAAEGALLVRELRCAACHEGISGEAAPPAPRLDEAAWRISPRHLRALLSDPAQAHPGGKMPDVLTSLGREEREAAVDALTAFLSARSSFEFLSEPIESARTRRGSKLFHSVGCVACHQPGEPATEGGEVPALGASAVGLTHVPEKYSLASLSDFLFQPLRVRPAGRMPDMGLTRSEAEDIASYLLDSGVEDEGALGVYDASLVERGGTLFQRLGCVSCHALEGMNAPVPVTTGRELDLSKGCLSEVQGPSPRYQLGEAQRAAIRVALEVPRAEPSDHARIDETLTAFNCIACHSRGERGGVNALVDAYFGTSEPELGDEARIPPDLTLAGAKLHLEWTQRVLFDAEKVRPYMDTRMPQFGEANLSHLPGLLQRVDHMDPVTPKVPEGKEREVARDAGRELLGTQGLSCVSCHNFNGKETQGFKGIDLITSHERLQFGWFKQFVISPQSLRPGIVMPEGWSGGVASHSTILEGDTDKQIDALWYFLSLGRSAPDPRGLTSVSSKLLVGDTTRTYRGRSNIAGFRGIAVGFPGGLSYAFDANNGTLSGLWRGEFVSARWDGQGAGGFNPLARPVRLAQDLSLYRLKSDEEPWPLKPYMDEENPVNPDPQYPRNHGYRFGGYYFDEEKVPTFMYSVGELSVEDKSVAILDGERPVLRRTLSLGSGEPIWFRVLTGEIEEVGEAEAVNVFKTAELQLSLPEGVTRLRSFGEEDPQEELLLLLSPDASGQTIWRMDYELLR